jgi:uncharacterized protein
MDTFEIEHVAAKNRYEIHLGSTVVGFSKYSDEDGRRLFLHTEVDPDYQGHGLATQLIEHALADTRASGKRIVALCPMVAAYVAKHHDYDDILDRTDVAPS